MTVIVIFLVLMLLLGCSRGLLARAWRSGRTPVRWPLREAPVGRIAGAERGDLPAEEAEQLIVAGRLAGVLDRCEYRDMIAQLAGIDEACSPLRVPELRDE
ncbi:hypothetical protein [Actinacidiphila soli]|uniref:hypothetical protein n=1 Tax=Actinacidiphila soli TaxID=2487275 RepID=UPI000FCCB607|nr:hypothetical protein [Actinacidiphila soli]